MPVVNLLKRQSNKIVSKMIDEIGKDHCALKKEALQSHLKHTCIRIYVTILMKRHHLTTSTEMFSAFRRDYIVVFSAQAEKEVNAMHLSFLSHPNTLFKVQCALE